MEHSSEYRGILESLTKVVNLSSKEREQELEQLAIHLVNELPKLSESEKETLGLSITLLLKCIETDREAYIDQLKTLENAYKKLKEAGDLLASCYQEYEEHNLPRVRIVSFARWVSDREFFNTWSIEQKLQYANSYVRDKNGERFKENSLRTRLSEPNYLSTERIPAYHADCKRLDDFHATDKGAITDFFRFVERVHELKTVKHSQRNRDKS